MATTMPKPPPAIPPRPSRSQDKGGNDAKAPPKIPPRPSRHLERKISEDRFAPSPLNEGFPKQPKTNRLAGDEVDKFSSEPHDLQERPGSSVAIPSLGEEGSEYAAVTDELQEPEDPEQTRTIGGDMKLHEPKPSLPVQSAKQRVAAIARIDSDRAASSFGIGKSPGDTSLTTSPRIKKSTTSFMSAEEGRDVDEEHGMPEIGQRVPMDRTTGDVQAPSAPSSPVAGKRGKHHGSRPTSRGSDYYGRHGHGHISNDRLEKEYYNKHPEELQKERTRPYHERQHDYAMSRNELNGIIRDTADRGSGLGTSSHEGTPSEEVGYQAHEEFTSRVASPRSTGAVKSGLRKELSPSELREPQENEEAQDEDMIHVDEPRKSTDNLADEEKDDAPILADDEVGRYPARADLHAAVEHSHEEADTSRPTSRHASRPASARRTSSIPEVEITRLEDVEEYEPLFEDGNEDAPLVSPSIDRASVPPRFPSKDIWEDAPSSVYQTTEVSTPDAGEAKPKRAGLPERDVLTPAQAFAKHQEELAEKEGKRVSTFVPRGGEKGYSWLPPESAADTSDDREGAPSPSPQRRFPSRDVWEDAPESLLHQTTVSSRQISVSPPVEQPDIPLRPVRSTEKPAIPSRPRPKKTPSDEVRAKPAISDKPKPKIPVRPARNAALSPEAKEAPPPVKPKPAVPTKPAGSSKIAAMQAGFMSDLNKRLQLGPSPPKKEEEEKAAEEEEKVVEAPKKPLSDARKGRARGPPRRAPAKSPVSPAAAPAAAAGPPTTGGLNLSLTVPHVVWSVDPEEGDVLVNVGESEVPTPKAVEVSPKAESPELKVPADTSPVDESPEPSKPASVEPEPSTETSPVLSSPMELSPEGESPKEMSPAESSPEQLSPKEESPREELAEETSPLEELPVELSPKVPSPKDIVDAAPVEEESPVEEEPPIHVIPAKADLAAVEPLDEDTTEGGRLGELQAHAKGRSVEREVVDFEVDDFEPGPTGKAN